ncbi:ribosomal protein S18 acetylase RimI-like enzyme [Peribacillus deserti]|uniref:Ribosomal protein S18 acetylase RimI-like enzyme n=1 Tax=Peribacillus deserti TaxID=673318 RepID=A0ABS2QMA4_9BACI|nr:GNAT family N-acetyltransferase [Peribacillus deserti]MBM7693844.1 ribosomal protein S18 acetylase RimI-like enzyme [Peribacillus deserti]
MIKIIAHTEIQNAEEILRIQIPAYKKEAELIGFNGIPQLKDQIHDIQQSREIFAGFYENRALCGFVSYEVKEDILDICRLVVHPEHFLKGIAGKLIQYVMESNSHLQKVSVSTGTLNTPAMNLYKKMGFNPMSTTEIAKGITVTHLVKLL